MSIPTECSNPECQSRLHFVDDTYAYLEWLGMKEEEE